MKGKIQSIILYAVIFVLSLAAGIVLTEMPDKRIATETVIQDDILYTPTGEEMSGDKININTATEKTFATLDGIGEKLSERIVEYRSQNGEFKTTQNLMDVPGIGIKLYESIEDKICVK